MHCWKGLEPARDFSPGRFLQHRIAGLLEELHPGLPPSVARGIFTSVRDLSRKLMRYIRAYSKNCPPLLNGNTPTFGGESSHANELAATGI
jgi:hypothetical protein